MNDPADVSARPLIIGGMHRSGSSLTASIFASAGLDLGPRLLAANSTNPLGHYEDLDFLDLHCRALAAQGLDSDGYTATDRGSFPAALEPEARSLVAARMQQGVAWGWKEPRTVLFLDYWSKNLPDARYVFVYRRPWEVADSLFRRGDTTFVLNPALALDVWTHYNRLILDFVRRHAARCAVFEISQVIDDPGQVVATVRSRLEIPLTPPANRYREALFTQDRSPTHSFIVRALAPETWHTYVALSEVAGVPVEPVSTTAGTMSVRDCAVLEWARASRAEAQVRQAANRADRLEVDETRPRAAQPSPQKSRRPTVRSLLAGVSAVSRLLVRRPQHEASPVVGPALLPIAGRGDDATTQRAA